ncbi:MULTISPECIES: ribosome small subunit-dependent GTPase A [unclassified Microcoleus]|uniref:ribosome small subunit-dependent GTPase A n=1 Tax=unclassified Microcoleus TaxID=2642155 RepID=UPI002FD00BBE
MILNSSSIVGTVVAVQANFYRVRLDPAAGIHENIALADAPILLCTRRTRLKKINQQVMVGDRVVVDEPDWTDRRGAISEVFPRQTELNRPPVANADRILLVFALAEPNLDPASLTRFLVKAESTGLEVNLCLNKCDLISPQELEQWRDRLSSWGYEPMFISVRSGLGVQEAVANLQNTIYVKQIVFQPLSDNIDSCRLPFEDNSLQVNSIDPLNALSSVQNPLPNLLESRTSDKITIICGPSGVGKSSLINQLIPALNLRVNAVSGKLGRGRHTTRHVELFELPGGGLLADTPGFNQPALECDPSELAEYFPEARQRLAVGSCQFSDCSHRDEPNCVVRGSWERYQYYLSFLEEAIVRQQALQNSSSAESSLKQQTKSDGTQQYEPKLLTKRYRRSSRRLQHQSLQEMCQEDLEEF